MEKWDACAFPVDPERLRGRVCYGGLDLSSGPADLTAFALYWPKSGALRVWAFLPAASLEQKIREDNAPYRAWAEAGHIVVMLQERSIADKMDRQLTHRSAARSVPKLSSRLVTACTRREYSWEYESSSRAPATVTSASV